MQVTETIYGPGATRHARVLLAVPGHDYPEDYVLAITGGDRSLIARDLPDDELVAKILDAFEETPQPPAEGEQLAGLDDAAAEALDGLTVAQLRELAAERGVKVASKATKLQLIGALTAAGVTDEQPTPAEEE